MVIHRCLYVSSLCVLTMQKTSCCSKLGGSKQEVNVEWGTIRTSIRTFTIFNDLDDNITSIVLPFADDTKAFRK